MPEPASHQLIVKFLPGWLGSQQVTLLPETDTSYSGSSLPSHSTQADARS